MAEVAGLALVGAGFLLFLSLVSYDVKDVPSFVPLLNTTSAPNADVKNWVGIVGAVFGGYSLFFLGIASFWLAALLVGMGVGKLFVEDFSLRERAGWALLNVICAACLAQLLPEWFGNWHDHFRAHGAGGYVGSWLGKRALGQLFGAVGALVFLGVLYFCSLVLTTGFHPIRFLREVAGAVFRFIEERKRKRLESMDESDLMAEREKELVQKTKKLEKKLKKIRPQAAVEKENEEGGELEKPKQVAASTPAPKIIDASVPTGGLQGGAKSKQIQEGLASLRLEGYELPSLELLDSHEEGGVEPAKPEELLEIQQQIIGALQQFGIECTPGDITKGPTITRYELYPAQGVRVDRIVALEKDIARQTKAERINILAPIPGKDTVGIELANSKKVKVILRELFESDAWLQAKGKLPIALGKDVYGKTIIGDLAQMPHCLVAGTTGSGKSVCINSIIASLLFRHTPEDLRFIMIDPKVVELQMFNALPHLVTPVVTEPKKVLLALRWVIGEMEKRYKIFARVGVRNVSGFNTRPLDEPAADGAKGEENGEGESGERKGFFEEEDDEDGGAPVRRRLEEDLVIPYRMPYIVVIIDELADLMQTAPADVEGAIARITQMARAAGIHMIVATQTPRADVVTGIIKANIPTRIAFQVASKIDSRVILDENGADKLLGQGDMLYLPPGTSKLTRSQGAFVTDEEMKRVVDFVAKQGQPTFDPSIHDKLSSDAGEEEDVTEEDEELVERCLEIIRQEKKASTSMLQRRLRLGYTRAARVVDILEQRGILGAKDGAKDREILVDLETL